MGLILDAGCDGCGFSRADLRLGATHGQIAEHDVNTLELYGALCCGTLQSVRVFMGQPLPEVPCEACGVNLTLAPETRYRVATLKGEVLGGHPCPACGAHRLTFVATGRFT